MDLPIIVVGGGIAGITAAVELAEAGHQVSLVEKDPYLGGNVSRFNNYFPKLCPPSCGLEINFRRIRSNPRIRVYTGAEVKTICGKEGDFSVKIRLSPRLVNMQCTSCGLCAEVCPEDAAFVPGGLAFPMKYCIDPLLCKREACGKCLEVCKFDAIQLSATEGEIDLQAGRVIMATGWKLYDAARLDGYRYKEEADIITNLEFEEMLAACTRDNKKLLRPSDQKAPVRIAFVQCAGSRDQNHLPYCSAVCCSASIKQALTLTGMNPEIQSEIFYIDLRVSGRNESLVKKAEQHKQLRLTKGKVGRIHQGADGPILELEDILSGEKRKESFDMVVLAMGMQPNAIKGSMALNQEGFLLDEQEAGISVAGTCKRPMDVSSTVKDASASAIKSLHRE